MMVVGCDPGRRGALVVLDAQKKIRYTKPFDGMTEAELAKELLRLRQGFPIRLLVKEEFHSYGVDGRVSFDVGRQHGVIDLVANQCGFTMITVRAMTWQKAILPKDSGMKPKFLSQKTAVALFGEEPFRVPTKTGKPSKKLHDGLLDAALIALFGLSQVD